jgi:hypothetical protein
MIGLSSRVSLGSARISEPFNFFRLSRHRLFDSGRVTLSRNRTPVAPRTTHEPRTDRPDCRGQPEPCSAAASPTQRD